MKIALSFPGCHRRGGVERVVRECARFLAARGHQVTVFANDWDEDGLEGVEFRSVPVGRFPTFLRGASYFRECSKVLEAAGDSFDVISTHGVVCPLGGVHFVHSVHRAWIERSRELHGVFSARRLLQRLNPLHPMLLSLEKRHFRGRNYRKLIALTRDVKADLIRYYDVPESDIVIVPNGFDPGEFNVASAQGLRNETRIRLGYRDGDRVVIFVANELDRKGFGPLVRGIAALRDERVHLLAVGRLDPRRYAAEIAALGMKDRVRFTGPSRELAALYGAADVFALPTQYEAWGLVIVEALACGVPVLTSRLAGAAITVGEGMTGELLDDSQNVAEIAQKLRRLLDGGHLPRPEIAGSVTAFRVSDVLTRFESVLVECARAEKLSRDRGLVATEGVPAITRRPTAPDGETRAGVGKTLMPM